MCCNINLQLNCCFVVHHALINKHKTNSRLYSYGFLRYNAMYSRTIVYNRDVQLRVKFRVLPQFWKKSMSYLSIIGLFETAVDLLIPTYLIYELDNAYLSVIQSTWNKFPNVFKVIWSTKVYFVWISSLCQFMNSLFLFWIRCSLIFKLDFVFNFWPKWTFCLFVHLCPHTQWRSKTTWAKTLYASMNMNLLVLQKIGASVHVLTSKHFNQEKKVRLNDIFGWRH